MGGVYQYDYGDAEVEMKGFVLAKDFDDAKAKARKACSISEGDEEDVHVGTKPIMTKEQLEQLLITGAVETFYDDSE